MGYSGQIAAIPLGAGGLFTDAPQGKIPATNLVRVLNATFYNNVLEKDFGSRRWNSSALPAGVKSFIDFWPNETTQRVITVLEDGTVYRLKNYYTQEVVSASGSAPTTLNVNNYVTCLLGGAEEQGRNRKVFIFTGNDSPQVISGDATTRSNLTSPAADWSGTNQPFTGIFYRGFLWAWGNRNDPHRAYRSLSTNHEDFTTTPTSHAVYPGEGEMLLCGFVYRSRLWLMKYPRGLYYLVDTDSNSANWYFAKHSEDFGPASPFSALPFLDDVTVANQYGSLTSLKASLVFGDVAKSDVFHQLKVSRFAENEVKPEAGHSRQAIYYPKKNLAIFSFTSRGNYEADRLCILDYKDAPNPPKVTWISKDQPTCLALVKDASRVEKPFYGASDGYLYEMDQVDRWVGGVDANQTTYTFEAWTPDLDFSGGNSLIAEQVKIFDELEIVYEACGDWDLSVDVYIDGKFIKTMTFNMANSKEIGSELDSFILDQSQLSDREQRSIKKELNGSGRRIGFKLYQSGLGQNVRLTDLRIYYRLSGQQQKP